MCGIAGWFDMRGVPAQPELGQVRSMLQAIAHRGPDGLGWHCDGPAVLAHARLAVVGLDSGAQPLHDTVGPSHLVCNGEIFNHRALRAQLEADGERFATDSDCEVILPLYRRHGQRFVKHLNGQFALALWDGRQQQLVLARDAVGMRPLYYAQVGSRLAFASEAKALLALPGLRPALDPLSLADLFSTWAVRPGASHFLGIHSLPPGHMAVVDARGVRLHRWWDWPFDDALVAPDHSDADWEEQLAKCLSQAVELQLQAEVPVAAYLSGGLDSSLLCALANQQSKSRLHTFGLSFDEARLDEAEHQRQLARFLNVEHTAVRCSTDDMAQAFRQAVWHAEAPLVRTAPIPMMLLAQATRAAGFKVALSGEGADEAFGGYDLFKLDALRRFVARGTTPSRRTALAARLFPQLNPAGRSLLLSAPEAGHALAAQAPRIRATQRIQQLFSPALRRAIGGHDPIAHHTGSWAEGLYRWPALARAQYAEAHTLLSGHLLSVQGDRMAMAHGLEVRMPYLDNQVLALAGLLPTRLKLRGLREKVLLRRVAERWLPRALLQRRKQAFRAPESEVLLANGRPHAWVAEMLQPQALAESGLFEPQAVHRLLQKAADRRPMSDGDHIALVGVVSTLVLQAQWLQGMSPKAPA